MRANRIFYIIAGLSLLAAMLSGCNDEAPKQAKEVSRPVKALKVKKGEGIFSNKYPGRIKASREVNLAFRVKGHLMELPVKASQVVKKGELLAALDPRDFQLEVSRNKATYTESSKQYQRYRRLIKSGAVSQAALDGQRRSYLTAKAAYDEALAALADTSLRAPFSGVVAQVMVENHQEIKNNQVILSLQDISNLEVDVQVPEQQIIMSKGVDQFDLAVALDALPGKEFPATLKEMTTQADPATQTFTITVTLPRPEGFDVLPGMTAELRVKAHLNQERLPAAIQVPVEAVVSDESKGSRVWLIDLKEWRTKSKKVKLGQVRGNKVEVLSGLKEGDTIAVAGVMHLREGMKVHLLNGQAGKAEK
jgi:RND family efflux transporter MFP subunit